MTTSKQSRQKNKSRKSAQLIAVTLLALAFSIFALAGCSGGSASGTAAGAISFTDTAGHKVEMKQPAKKVVALDAASCEIVYALGAGDTLVGRGTYCTYPEEAQSVTAVDSGSVVNVEQIIALGPDLVITATMDTSLDVIKQLEATGIAVLESDTSTLEGVYKDIAHVGTVLGKTSEAEKLVSQMKSDFDNLAQKAKQQANYGTKSIYFEVSPLQYGLWAAGSNCFMDELAQIIGVKNTFSDVQDWAEVSEEQVISRNPDYILTTTMDMGTGDPVQEVLSRKGWENITAVAQKQVLSVSDNSLTVPGPRLVEGAQTLYNFVYGEAK